MAGPTDESASSLDRYSRQWRYAPLGIEGQRRIAAARALVVGCGALGSAIVNLLVRAGVGTVRVVDRDFVELSNLGRQVLFDEQDVADELPKAVAAARKLGVINSQVTVEPVVADLHPGNIESLAADVGVIVDGTDNFETRFLINDFAVKHGVPWVYGGCIGAEGQTMTILPGRSGCLRCLMEEPPPAGTVPTCDTAGILASAAGVIASIQALEALKILSGNAAAASPHLTIIELWENRIRQINLQSLSDQRACPACKGREFPWLEGRAGGQAALLCGRNSVQISPPPGSEVSLDALAAKLSPLGHVRRNEYLLRLEVDGHLLTVFPDGRTIIGGTDDIALAKSLHARYVGA